MKYNTSFEVIYVLFLFLHNYNVLKMSKKLLDAKLGVESFVEDMLMLTGLGEEGVLMAALIGW
jgi:hypothetical protein